MNFTVTEEIAIWYKNELKIETPAYIRFFPRYGFGGHIPGFSIGINQNPPTDVYVKTEVSGLTFYIESEDAWYFEDVEFHVSFNKALQEPTYAYES